MRYVIDGNRMVSFDEAHREIARALSFPAYYGANLDALWDMLTDMRGSITLSSAAAALNRLGAYGCQLLAVFYEASESGQGPRFTAEG